MKIISHILIIVVLMSLYSCGLNDSNDSTVEYFNIEIDSLIVDDSIAVNDTLNIGLKGPLGPNSCYSFSHYETIFYENDVSIKVIGKHILNQPCLEVLMSMREIYKIYNLRKGYYYIKIVNPNNNFLIDSVLVY